MIDTIQARRAVKTYDPKFEMPEQDIIKIVEHASLAPSSFNIQHWRPVAVLDKNLREELKKASFDQPQITDSSVLFILCADLNAWQKHDLYMSDVPDEMQDSMKKMINGFYSGKEQNQHDEALRSCGLFAQTLMLAAKSMGYDSGPMIGFQPDKVAKLINLPKDHIIGMFVVVGKGINLDKLHPRSRINYNKILVRDKF